MEETKKNQPGFLSKLLKFLVNVIKFPIKLIMNLARMINEIRVFIISLITLIVVFIVIIVVIVIFKPEPVWGSLRGFLNADLQIKNVENVSLDDIYKKINEGNLDEVEDLEEDEHLAILNNKEITTLFRKSTLISEFSHIEIKNDLLIFYINSESKEAPLWFIVNIEEKNNKDLIINNVGFKRFALPWFVANMFDQTFGGLSNLLSKQNNNGDAVIMFNQILNTERFNEQMELTDVKMVDGEVELIFEK